MDEFDQKILNAMREQAGQTQTEEAALNPLQLIFRSFRSGTFRWVAPLVMVLALVFGGLGLYCAWQLLHVMDVGSKIHWGVGCILSFLIMSIIRLWFFMEMNRLSILREVKRVELQLAVLAQSLKGSQS